jgi:NitT/TauT family transport system permease protein
LNLKVISFRISIVIFFFAFWEILPTLGILNEFSVPKFSKVIVRVAEILNPYSSTSIIPTGFYNHLYVTLFEIGVAFFITLCIGLPIGFLIGGFRLITQIYEPLIYLIYAFPSVALYPLIVIILGFGPQSKIVFGFFLGLFPLILNTIAALRGIRPSYILIARLFGCTTIQLILKVILPASIPFIISGIRLALAFNTIGVIFGEMVASSVGLGFIINSATYKLDALTEYAVIVISLSVTFLILEAISFTERLGVRK